MRAAVELPVGLAAFELQRVLERGGAGAHVPVVTHPVKSAAGVRVPRRAPHPLGLAHLLPELPGVLARGVQLGLEAGHLAALIEARWVLANRRCDALAVLVRRLVGVALVGIEP